MLNIGDRVLQTTTTQGTGTINLDGTVTGFRSFVAGIGNGKKTVYLISDNTNWEVGIGTITDANPDTLSRTTILSSSNSNAAVNWGPGTRNVYCVMAAPVLPITDENLNFMQMFGAGGGTANSHTVTMPVTPLAYSPDMQFFYRPTIANTTAGFKINVNALGDKDAKVKGTDPGIGFAGIGDVLFCVYKSSNNTIEVLNLSKIGELAYQTRNLNIPINDNQVTVVSATTPDIWGVNGNVINYTGTVPATGFTTAPQAGARRTLICAGAAVFTAGSNMLINGITSGQNFTAAAGDRIDVHAITTTQFRIYITKADGTSVAGGVGLLSYNNMIEVQDQKASGTNGGTATAGSYIARDLNTVIVNNIAGASLSANRISLPAGTYVIEADAPFINCANVKLRAVNSTDNTDLVLGSNQYGFTTGASVNSILKGTFTLAGTKNVGIDYRCGSTQSNTGLGQAQSFGTEVYTTVRIWKVA